MSRAQRVTAAKRSGGPEKAALTGAAFSARQDLNLQPLGTELLHGNAPRSNRRGRQRCRVEDQRQTPSRRRDCEGHSRQAQGSVAHVYRGGAIEGGAPVAADGPVPDLTFYGDVLRHPEE